MEEEWTVVGTYEGPNDEGHVIRSPEGAVQTVPLVGMVDSRLKSVPVGARVKVVKTGRKVRAKNGSQVDEYTVYVAKGSLAPGGSPEPPRAPEAAPLDRAAIRAEIMADAERHRREVDWLREEAARLGYRLVRRPDPAS